MHAREILAASLKHARALSRHFSDWRFVLFYLYDASDAAMYQTKACVGNCILRLRLLWFDRLFKNKRIKVLQEAIEGLEEVLYKALPKIAYN